MEFWCFGLLLRLLIFKLNINADSTCFRLHIEFILKKKRHFTRWSFHLHSRCQRHFSKYETFYLLWMYTQFLATHTQDLFVWYRRVDYYRFFSRSFRLFVCLLVFSEKIKIRINVSFVTFGKWTKKTHFAMFASVRRFNVFFFFSVRHICDRIFFFSLFLALTFALLKLLKYFNFHCLFCGRTQIMILLEIYSSFVIRWNFWEFLTQTLRQRWQQMNVKRSASGWVEKREKDDGRRGR